MGEYLSTPNKEKETEDGGNQQVIPQSISIKDYQASSILCESPLIPFLSHPAICYGRPSRINFAS